MRRSRVLAALVFLTALTTFLSAPARAVRPTDMLLPRSVKGYVSFADADDFEARWQQTQLGQLINDPTMKPFVDDLREQAKQKWDMVDHKLGVSIEELNGVASGEVGLAVIERPGKEAAVALIMDVSDREEEAQSLLQTASQRLTTRGAKRQTVTEDGTELFIFELPAKERGQTPEQTVYFLHDNMLCAVDDRAEALAIRRRFDGQPKDNLRSVTAYIATMKRCRGAANTSRPDVRWFTEPFGLIWALQSMRTVPLIPEQHRDLVKIFHEQGFDAIRGVGGYVNMVADGKVEWVHRTAVYAPPVAGKERDPLRWNLAMRILQLPNSEPLKPQSWAPRMSAAYNTINLDMPNAFDHVDTLFDALTGVEDSFHTTMVGLEKDAYGPKINVRREFVAHLGQRVTVITYYATPITVDCERSLFALEAADEKPLSAALTKIMQNDPDFVSRDFEGVRIWERVPPEEDDETLDVLNSLTTLDEDEPDADEDANEIEPVLPRSAVCVAKGNLFIASDIEFLMHVLTLDDPRELLENSEDYRQTEAAVSRLVTGEMSGWSFSRTDESLRPSYELIRQGKMPEAQTLVGRLLNELLTSAAEEEEGLLRKQQVDGSQLPNFERVRRYFGPAGRVLRSDNDGWLLTGAVLHKEAP